MKIIEAIKILIEYQKTFKTSKIVSFAGDDVYDAYSFACSYRAQESVCQYYRSFYPNVSFEEAMELIRYSKDLRDTITEVLKNRILKAKMDEFDFTQNAEDIRFFPEYGLDDRVTISKLYDKGYGIKLMQLLSLRIEQSYYRYIKKEKGYQKEWKEFIDELLKVDEFCAVPHNAMKYWIAHLTFPSEVWSNKKVIGLMNEAQQRIDTFGRQE